MKPFGIERLVKLYNLVVSVKFSAYSNLLVSSYKCQVQCLLELISEQM